MTAQPMMKGPERDDFEAAMRKFRMRITVLSTAESTAFRLGRSVRVDAGGWGMLELRQVDLDAEVTAEMEHHEARERHLDRIEADGDLWEWDESRRRR